ncbi:MAG: MBL fold metallo-hydrolase [Promethearchaeota archaeon]|nr:MAG: MBL fold metallo-hydrolase [Candidatus Lokiarchaeota archaeon]
MTSIKIFDGNDTIGGNKIYLEENGKGIFLDFGMNFKKYGAFFQEYLIPRYTRGIYDLIHLNLIPHINIYRKDLIPLDLDVLSFPTLNVEAILISHAHMDHCGNIGLLKLEYPIIASTTTFLLLKAISDTSSARLGSDVVYFSPKNQIENGNILESQRQKLIRRDLICTDKFTKSFNNFFKRCVQPRKEFIEGTISNIENRDFGMEIKSYEVDHSIYGATGYLISADNTIAYTGDFRLHGKKGKKSEVFFRNAKDAAVLIIEGTRAAREDINESEEIVFQKCLETAEQARGLIVADFTARNFERLEIFKKIAKQTGKTLIVTAKDAYLLDSLENADGINRMENVLVYEEFKKGKKNWEYYLLNQDNGIDFIKPTEILKEQSNYIICFSLFDLKNLLDIKPTQGTYIYSSSEAFEEESEFDFQRLYNWLNHIGFEIFGFEIIKKSGRLKPKFMEGYHASGHASKSDLIKVIDIVDPDIIIPVHTDNPKWFSKQFDNAVILKDNETYRL